MRKKHIFFFAYRRGLLFFPFGKGAVHLFSLPKRKKVAKKKLATLQVDRRLTSTLTKVRICLSAFPRKLPTEGLFLTRKNFFSEGVPQRDFNNPSWGFCPTECFLAYPEIHLVTGLLQYSYLYFQNGNEPLPPRLRAVCAYTVRGSQGA